MTGLSISNLKQMLNFSTKSETKTLNVSWFKHNTDDDSLNYNPSYQRGEVWCRNGQRELIRSLLEGINIPQIVLNENDDEKYDLIDGKQRLTAIMSFMNNDFPVILNGEEYYFSDFNKKLQNIFEVMQIQTVIYKNLPEENQRDIFERINYGSPLKDGEKVKGSNSRSLKIIDNIVQIYSDKLKEIIKNDRDSHYLIFSAIVALVRKQYEYAEKGKPVIKYINHEQWETISDEDISEIKSNVKCVLDKFFELFDKVKKYNDKRNDKPINKVKFINLRTIMSIIYIINVKKDIKDKEILQILKLLWHIKMDSREFYKSNEEIETFSENLKNLSRKNSNNEPFYEKHYKQFQIILKFIKKKNTSLRDSIASSLPDVISEIKCPICNSHSICKSNFEMGHIISRANAGIPIKKNMMPICSPCNKSMGTEDMDTYCENNNIPVRFDI